MSAKLILSALAFAAASSAAPSVAPNLTPPTFPNITVCSGSISPPNGCADIPLINDTCVSLTGGLSFFNKEISWAQIPAGFACKFFDGTDHDDVAVLTRGIWNLVLVEGVSGTPSFNDLTSSISCSPINCTTVDI
ncbi:hypothetical protein B0H13DRAFT_2304316 [Mycena leptocephala]|nr:hypothetical protein B0H13DRAFT_2304316 [Mycena leptocephala]